GGPAVDRDLREERDQVTALEVAALERLDDAVVLADRPVVVAERRVRPEPGRVVVRERTGRDEVEVDVAAIELLRRGGCRHGSAPVGLRRLLRAAVARGRGRGRRAAAGRVVRGISGRVVGGGGSIRDRSLGSLSFFGGRFLGSCRLLGGSGLLRGGLLRVLRLRGD